MDDIRYKQILADLDRMHKQIDMVQTGLVNFEQFIEAARAEDANRAQARQSGTVVPHSFQMFEQQDKGEAFRKALAMHGYRQVTDIRRAGMILSHHDQMWELNQAKRERKPFFLHPHSARSMIIWDGIVPPSPHVTCNFVFAPGHAEIMKKYGYPNRVEVCGWAYSERKPFSPSEEVKRVLFAPIHPNRASDSRGTKLSRVDQQLNGKAYAALSKLKIDLTVRLWDTPEANGLPELPRVVQKAELSAGSTLKTLTDEKWDVVVSHQTFAYTAVALGIPTVMFGEETPPHNMDKVVRSWDRYKDIVMYPLDLLADVPEKVLHRAAETDEDISAWRDRMIGESFDASSFVTKLEAFL